MTTGNSQDAARLLDIIENTPLGLMYEENGMIVRVNRALEKLLGYDRDEIIGRDSLAFRREILEGKSDRFLDESSHTFFLQRKNAPPFWAMIESSKFPLDTGGEATVWTIRDVTRQKDAELRLRQMSMAVDQSSNSVVITDTRGIIQYVNPTFVRVTGYSEEEALGRTPALLKSGRTPEYLYAEMWRTITRGEEWSGQFINRKKSGEIYEEHVTVAPLRDEQGAITHFIATKENITELKRARRQAERASKAKGEFLAYMSHEIRTPLNVIIGMTGLLLDSAPTPEQEKTLKRVKSSADHLLAIVNDILDYSRIEAGMLTIDTMPFSLKELVRDLDDAMSFLAGRKGITFSVSMPDSLDFLLIGDRLRLHQVLFNLLSNGIKFTEEGRVELRIDILESRPGIFRVTFVVRDTGIGIKQESLKTIFDSFVQADSAITRKFGGSGLGLSISNQLVRLMGGKLQAQSVPGLGSSFSFTLELARAAGTSAQPATTSSEEGPGGRLNILLAEDNEGNQELATAILKRAGHRVEVAENGLKALELIASGAVFDVILMDMQMPRLDGLRATRCIRKAEGGQPTEIEQCEPFEQELIRACRGRRLRIVAMTANAMLSDKNKCRDAGVDAFLAKPYTGEDLLAVLRHGDGDFSRPAEKQAHGGGVQKEGGVSLELCRRHLMENFDLDEQSCSRVLAAQLTSLRDSVIRLRRALASGDREEVQLLAHKIKGGMANLNCREPAETARKIEDIADSADLGELRKLTGRLEHDFNLLDRDNDRQEEPC